MESIARRHSSVSLLFEFHCTHNYTDLTIETISSLKSNSLKKKKHSTISKWQKFKFLFSLILQRFIWNHRNKPPSLMGIHVPMWLQSLHSDSKVHLRQFQHLDHHIRFRPYSLDLHARCHVKSGILVYFCHLDVSIVFKINLMNWKKRGRLMNHQIYHFNIPLGIRKSHYAWTTEFCF